MQNYFEERPFHQLKRSGWTIKQTQLMNNMFWMSLRQPQTMNEGLRG